MNAHNRADMNAAKAAHERVKAAATAMTQIPQPANTNADRAHDLILGAADQAHARATQAADHAHEQRMQLGQQRYDMLSQLMAQQHERGLAAMQPPGVGVEQQVAAYPMGGMGGGSMGGSLPGADGGAIPGSNPAKMDY